MKITRKIAEETEIVIELTAGEILQAYCEYLPIHHGENIRYFLEEHGYPEQDDETVREIAEEFMRWMEQPLGELENCEFDKMMEYNYPEIEKEE